MNKIVREHYPVERLPEDLRKHFPNDAVVTISVAEEDQGVSLHEDGPSYEIVDRSLATMRTMQQHVAARGESVTADEAVRRVRELRDEWDD